MKGGHLIKDASLQLMLQLSVNQGSESLDENLCIEGIFDASGTCFFGTYDLLIGASPGGNFGEDSANLNPASFIDVENDLNLNAAGKGNIADVPIFKEQFSEVPEPASVFLLLTGLAFAFLGRRTLRSGAAFPGIE
jgi:hypothetical protein